MKDCGSGEMPSRTRVAIIGTGLAGLTTGYLLQNDDLQRYQVTLFEQADNLSFDAASVAVKNQETGAIERVDLPMRATAGGYYANLNRMYDHLGIPLHPVRFLFAFAEQLATTPRRLAESATASATVPNGAPAAVNKVNSGRHVRTDPGTYFVHASNLHQTPPPWPGNRGVIAHIVEILYLIVCQFWFSIACFLVPPVTNATSSKVSTREGGESFDEYLRRVRVPRRFVTRYLLPLMSSVSTCTHGEILDFPASDLVNYKKLSHGHQHYAVCGGVNQVQLKLAEGMKDVRLGARVLEVIPQGDEGKVLVRWQSSQAEQDVLEEVFDRAVLAVSPDVAGRIFKPLAPTIGRIPTVRVESSVLGPLRKSAEAPPPYSVVSDVGPAAMGCMHHTGDESPVQVITLRTQFSGACPRTEALHSMPSGVVVSTCPLEEKTDQKKALQSAWFTRTLRTPESRALVEKMMGRSSSGESLSKKIDAPNEDGWTSGEDNVWLAGAWCWDGMVLLEGCIVSAMQVASDFGVDVPWRANV